MSTAPEPLSPDRRPIKTRSAWWAQAIARVLVRVGTSPNQVSVSSVVFAFLGAGLMIFEARGAVSVLPLLIAAACIQLRLLANMLDGLIAVEGGRQTRTGELYNEIPDRIADVAFLAAAGYAAHWGEWGIALGWSASVLAVTTAYIRAIGARRGWPQDFRGPLAKPQRMFLLTLACLLAAVEKGARLPPRVLFGVLVVINLGTLLTCARRTSRLARELGSGSDL
jgi:phosphatidylglycerophosphate synthase